MYMKKCIHIIMLAIMSIAFVSCGEKVDEPKLDDRLVGTKWQCEDWVHALFYGGTCFQVYEFTSTTEVDRYTTRNGAVDDSDGTFTYTLNYPSITINVVDSKGVVTPTDFTFTDSRTMVRTGTDGYGNYQKYLKQ